MRALYASNSEGAIVRRRWAFVVRNGPDEGRQFLPDRTPALAGAAPAADLRLRDETVSRFHAELDLQAGAIRVRDLGSTNGVFAHDERVPSAWLHDGHSFMLGETRIDVRAREERAPPPPPPAIPLPAPLVAASPSTRYVQGWVHRLADAPEGVCFFGPKGSGRKTWAKRLHALGPRAKGPFVELSAMRGQALFGVGGALDRARGGSLLIDTPGALPPSAQVRLREMLDDEDAPRVLCRDVAPVDGELVAGLAERVAVVHLELESTSRRVEDLNAFVWDRVQALGMSKLGPAIEHWRSGQARVSFKELEAATAASAPPEGPAQGLRRALLQDLLQATSGDVDDAAHRLGTSQRVLFRQLSSLEVPIPE